MGQTFTLPKLNEIHTPTPVRIFRGKSEILHSKCGLVNISKNGIKEIMVCDYDKISEFNESKVIVTKNGKFGILANTGKIVVSLNYDSLYLLEFIDRRYNDYKRRYVVIYKRMGKYGIIDYNTGKELSPSIYDHIKIDDKILICTKDKKVGLASIYGSEILPCEYDNILSLKSNLIQVGKKNKYGVVNLSTVNTIAIPIVYDAISFSNDNKEIIAFNGKSIDKFINQNQNWIKK